MLTHFGTLFAACRNYDSLTHLLTLLNFHKNDVSRGTLAVGCFTWNKNAYMLKRFKLKFLHYLTKIIWWFRGKVVSLQRDLEI